MAQLFDTGIFNALGANSALGAGYKLFWYAAGTTTPVNTFSDPDLTTPNTNPVVADANGRFPSMWLDVDSYKYVFANADGVPIKTQDDYTVEPEAPTVAAGLVSFLAGSSALPIANGGTGATAAATAIGNLGGLPTAGGTMTGTITQSTKGKYLFWNPAGCTSGEVFITPSASADPTSAAGQWWLRY